MRAVVQRVSRASVRVGGEVAGAVDGSETGALLVLVGITHDDTEAQAATLARKVHSLRILRDERSLSETGGPALLVSQFTLYGDARKGRRPSWGAAAPGHVAEPLYDATCSALRELGTPVETGTFGADMDVESVNDGPVTIWLEV